ncbi:MAG: IPT/TIG domain-containing protein [Candidatus Riflebacteria bacterium]|nr:IPT/TIG domain-containing protein [Candidatus Riflebacteria bacterium]
MLGGLKNLVPGSHPRRRQGRVGRVLRFLRAWLSILPACLVVLLGFLGGCANNTDALLPAVDPLANVADNRQTSQLPANSVTPASGTVGTVITVHGQGFKFPAGYAKFTFHGNGTTEIEVPSATTQLKVRVPPGAESGSFGFTISGRSSSRDTSGRIPSDTNLFVAYTVVEPGFTVTPAPVLNNT